MPWLPSIVSFPAAPVIVSAARLPARLFADPSPSIIAIRKTPQFVQYAADGITFAPRTRSQTGSDTALCSARMADSNPSIKVGGVSGCCPLVQAARALRRSVAVPVRVLRLPAPRVPAHFLDAARGAPAQVPRRERRIRVAGGHVARP